MALPNTGISTTLVGTTLGVATRNVGSLCTHSSVNRWSKYKPVPNTEVSFPSRDAVNVHGRKNWQGIAETKMLNSSPNITGMQSCGMWLPVLINYDSWPNVKAAIDVAISNHNWNRSMAIEYYPNVPGRLGDFRGYDHYATPFFSWEDQTSNKYLPPTEFAFGNLNVNSNYPYSLEFSDFPEIGANPYLCCAIFQGSNTQLFQVYSSNDYVAGAFNFPVVSSSSWPADSYKCYWFFADSQPSDMFIPGKIIPLYSTLDDVNPFTYTLEDQLNIIFSNYKYGFALGSQLLDYALLDGYEYYGPYGIHSNFNNSIQSTGFVIALDITNNAGGELILKGDNVAIAFNNYVGAVTINSTTMLGLYETNTSGAQNKAASGITISNGGTKTIYIEVGVTMSNVTTGEQFDLNFLDFRIYNSFVELSSYSVQCKYRSTNARSFYNLSTGIDFTSI